MKKLVPALWLGAGRQRRSDFRDDGSMESLQKRARRVPPRWRNEVEEVLISPAELRAKIRELAREIERDFAGRDLVVVALLNGTVIFLADLLRHLRLPLRLDFIGVSSYGGGTVGRKIHFTKELVLDVRGRDVLLVDDILDTGRTLACVLEKLRQLKPRRIRTCVLLDKPSRRVKKVEADWAGFVIPNEFVIGYGLDFAERYRNLPFIGRLRREIYEQREGASVRKRRAPPAGS